MAKSQKTAKKGKSTPTKRKAKGGKTSSEKTTTKGISGKELEQYFVFKAEKGKIEFLGDRKEVFQDYLYKNYDEMGLNQWGASEINDSIESGDADESHPIAVEIFENGNEWVYCYPEHQNVLYTQKQYEEDESLTVDMRDGVMVYFKEASLLLPEELKLIESIQIDTSIYENEDSESVKVKKKSTKKDNDIDEEEVGKKGSLMKPLNISQVLASVVGEGPMPRIDVMKKLWEYININGLQDSVDHKMINTDEKLKVLFKGKKQVNMFEMAALIGKHLS